MFQRGNDFVSLHGKPGNNDHFGLNSVNVSSKFPIVSFQPQITQTASKRVASAWRHQNTSRYLATNLSKQDRGLILLPEEGLGRKMHRLRQQIILKPCFIYIKDRDFIARIWSQYQYYLNLLKKKKKNCIFGFSSKTYYHGVH